MLRVVENVRRKHLDWVTAILAHKGWSQTQLAREAGINPSTLSKFLNDPTKSARLNTYTVENIERVGGIPAFQTAAPERVRGIAENEGEPYNGGSREIDTASEAVKAGRNGVDAWVLRSRSLEAAGYVPGDVLMVDLNASPQSGDVVCAQVYGRESPTETVFRIYEHPFLVAATLDGSLMKPLLVDNDRVAVRGVVIASLRERRVA